MTARKMKLSKVKGCFYKNLFIFESRSWYIAKRIKGRLWNRISFPSFSDLKELGNFARLKMKEKIPHVADLKMHPQNIYNCAFHHQKISQRGIYTTYYTCHAMHGHN